VNAPLFERGDVARWASKTRPTLHKQLATAEFRKLD